MLSIITIILNYCSMRAHFSTWMFLFQRCVSLRPHVTVVFKHWKHVGIVSRSWSTSISRLTIRKKIVLCQNSRISTLNTFLVCRYCHNLGWQIPIEASWPTDFTRIHRSIDNGYISFMDTILTIPLGLSGSIHVSSFPRMYSLSFLAFSPLPFASWHVLLCHVCNSLDQLAADR